MADDIGQDGEIPSNVVWLLVRQTGIYEDFREVPIRAFQTEEAAVEAREKAFAEFAQAKEKFPEPAWPDDSATDAEWHEWEAAGSARAASFRGSLTVDPECGPTSAWVWFYEDPDWVVQWVPFAPTPLSPSTHKETP